MRLFQSIFTLLFLFTSLLTQETVGQETVLVGQVINRADKTPISHVNVYFKNSTIGAETNEEGYFMLRNKGPENNVIFSAIGFKTASVKIKPGYSAGIQMELEEQSNLLNDVLVTPGANPALSLMQKVVEKRNENDLKFSSNFKAFCTQNEMVALAKRTSYTKQKSIFKQLHIHKISEVDSSLITPMYDATYYYEGHNNTWTIKGQDSIDVLRKYIETIIGDPSPTINFYDNSISLFGVKFTSPLSEKRNMYYDYFLSDSIVEMNKKQYIVHFRSRNPKNLAFNGSCKIDSASSALVSIEATLPRSANINFVRNLFVSQHYKNNNHNQWTPLTTNFVVYLEYLDLSNQETTNTGAWIQRKAHFDYTSTYSEATSNLSEELPQEMTRETSTSNLKETPMIQTARWIADALLTGYMQVGKIDIGKIPQLFRTNSIEGLRVNLPFRTNEYLWQKVSIGGYIGYGFNNKDIQYSAIGQMQLPTQNRSIFTYSYTKDLRRIDYDYNAFQMRENPLQQGDEDFTSDVFRTSPMNKLNLRKEISAGIMNDWTTDFETQLLVRANEMLANDAMPMLSNNLVERTSFTHQSATIVTRLSHKENVYDNHLQRIYISNQHPIFYGIAEIGNYQLGNTSGYYGKLRASVMQRIKMEFGQFNYLVQTDWIIGKVPYPLLIIPSGNESSMYSFYTYNLMNTMEFVADKALQIHSELLLNGILLNQIPVIRTLNLREFISLHAVMGGLDTKHQSLMTLPSFTKGLSQPYAELGVGFTNILRLFALQSIWRIGPNNSPSFRKWGVLFSVKLSF